MLIPMEEQAAPSGIRVNVKVDPDLHRELRRLAAETGERFTQLIPRLLRAAVREELSRLVVKS